MGRTLFYKRIRKEWREKMRAAASIVDWTVALYIVVPALFFAGVYYKSLWKDATDWTNVPLAVLLFFMCLLGVQAVRTFLEEADSLFLVQKPNMLRTVIKRGLVYTFLKICFTVGLVFLLAWPILENIHHLSFFQLVVLYVFFVCTMYIFAFYQMIIANLVGEWKKRMIQTVVFPLFVTIFVKSVLLIIQYTWIFLLYVPMEAVFLFLFVKNVLRFQRFFSQEIVRERQMSMKWTTVVLGLGGNIQKPITEKQSILFPRSKRLLFAKSKQWQVAELFAKMYYRNPTNRKFYFQIIGYSLVAFFIAPFKIEIGIMIFVLFAIFKQAKDEWKQFSNKPLMRLYCSQGEILLMHQPRMFLLWFPTIVYGIFILGVFHVKWALVTGVLFLLFMLVYIFVRGRKNKVSTSINPLKIGK